MNIIHVMVHEIGHSLGLRHSQRDEKRLDVMNPYYNEIMDLSDYDIYRIRKIYGTRIFSRWNMYSRIKRWLSIRKKRF